VDHARPVDFELVSQRDHVDLEEMTIGAVFPYLAEELFLVHDSIALAHEDGEDVELGGGEADRRPCPRHRPNTSSPTRSPHSQTWARHGGLLLALSVARGGRPGDK
jgi:hypothetical protein